MGERDGLGGAAEGGYFTLGMIRCAPTSGKVFHGGEGVGLGDCLFVRREAGNQSLQVFLQQCALCGRVHQTMLQGGCGRGLCD